MCTVLLCPKARPIPQASQPFICNLHTQTLVYAATPSHDAALHDPAVNVRSVDFVFPPSHTRAHTCPWLLLPLQAVPIDACWLAIPGSMGHASPAAMVRWPKASPALNSHLHQSSVYPAGQAPRVGAIPLHVAALHDPAVHVRSLDFVYPASHTRPHTCPWLLLPVQAELIEACWLATPGLMAHASPTVMFPCFKDCPLPYPRPCLPSCNQHCVSTQPKARPIPMHTEASHPVLHRKYKKQHGGLGGGRKQAASRWSSSVAFNTNSSVVWSYHRMLGHPMSQLCR